MPAQRGRSKRKDTKESEVAPDYLNCVKCALALVVVPDWRVTYQDILAQSPELTSAQAIVCEKQALILRQQAQPTPNVLAQIDAGYDNGTDNGMINLQLSAPFPFWNNNSGNVAATYADYVRATQEVGRIQQSIRSRPARVAQEFDWAMKSA